MASMGRIIQLENRAGEEVFPVIINNCIYDGDIREEKLDDDVLQKLNGIVIKLEDSGESRYGRKIYKPTDANFANKIDHYYTLYNNGKPINFLFTPPVEDNTTKNYQVPVKQFTKNGRSGNYYLYGRNGDYSIECTLIPSVSVEVYIDADSVASDDIKDTAITTDKIADKAVTADKIADGVITSDKLANSSNYFTKDNILVLSLSGQLDVEIGFAESPVSDILSAALNNLNNDLPIVFKISTFAQTNSPTYTTYSSDYYYSSTTNKSTEVATNTLGTYFRAPNNKSAVYKVEIKWTDDTASEPEVTMTAVS